MLGELFKILRDEYGVILCKIKDIPKSCCKYLEYEVIDFDKIKDKYCELNKTKPSSSCDCLDISKGRIDFIEMKGFEEFKKRKQPLDEEKVDDQVSKFNFEKKLKDSYEILYEISKRCEINLNDFNKRYFIVTDLEADTSGIIDLNFTLSALSEISSDDRLIYKILNEKIKQNTELKWQRPILVDCCGLLKYLEGK